MGTVGGGSWVPERGSGWRGCWMVAASTDTALATSGHRAQLEGSRAGEGRQVVGAG